MVKPSSGSSYSTLRSGVPSGMYLATKSASFSTSFTSPQTALRPSVPGLLFNASWHWAANCSSVVPIRSVSSEWLFPSVRIAVCPIERQFEVLGQRLDRVGVLLIGVAVCWSHDDAAERAVAASAWRQHGRHQRCALVVPQGQKQRHLAQDVRALADVLLDIDRGQRLVALRCLRPFAADIFFHGMAHDLGFQRGLALVHQPEPGPVTRSIADILHV